MPGVTINDALRCMSIIRSRALNFDVENPKAYDKDTVLVVCPLVDMINHSFNPNCVLEPYYNSFENESYV